MDDALYQREDVISGAGNSDAGNRLDNRIDDRDDKVDESIDDAHDHIDDLVDQPEDGADDSGDQRDDFVDNALDCCNNGRQKGVESLCIIRVDLGHLTDRVRALVGRDFTLRLDATENAVKKSTRGSRICRSRGEYVLNSRDIRLRRWIRRQGTDLGHGRLYL
eukprot:Pompholyxophrys_punicea_v1_NODE_103_length_3477_cov_5.215371.p4 type:complete len:163 gc:universal NODE_103_length_3477_cov_5.215371:963-475(-)